MKNSNFHIIFAEFSFFFDLKIPMHVKLANWKASEKHLSKKCAHYFSFHMFSTTALSEASMWQCVKYYLIKMEFSQSPEDVHIYFAWKVHMHVKFAHFWQCPHGCQIYMVIHLKILHGCMIFFWWMWKKRKAYENSLQLCF